MSTEHADEPVVGVTGRPEELGPLSSLVPLTARAYRSLAAALLREVGLVPGQELLLMKLWAAEPQSQVELAQLLRIEPPTAAKMLARLERTGLVCRERSTRDRRVILVSLTDRGRALRDPVLRIWADLERRAVGDLTFQEQATLLALLRRVVGHVDRRPGAGAPAPGDDGGLDPSGPSPASSRGGRGRGGLALDKHRD